MPQVEHVLELFGVEDSYLQRRFVQHAELYGRARKRTAELLQRFYGSDQNAAASLKNT